jgi:hypothetical protein
MAALAVALAALAVSSPAWTAQEFADGDPALYYYLIAAPTNVRAVDHPNDNGGTIVITWTLSVNDTPDGGIVTGYAVRRARALNGPYVDVGQTTARSDRYVDSSAEIGVPFFYRVDAVAGGVSSAADPVNS